MFYRHFQLFFSYIVAVGFIVGGNRSTLRKPTDLPQVTDKVYHIMLFGVHLAWAGLELTKIVVIGTDCIHVGSYKSDYIDSYKSNYDMITTTTTPYYYIDHDA